MSFQRSVFKIQRQQQKCLPLFARALLAQKFGTSSIVGVSTSMPSAAQLRYGRHHLNRAAARKMKTDLLIFYRYISTSLARLARESSDAGRHVGRKGQFWDLKHDPDADWKPKDDESDYEYAVYPDEHEHISWVTWMRWLLITLLQSAGALALVGGVSSTVVSHGVAKSQVLGDSKEVMAATLERVEEYDLFIETMVQLAALIDAELGASPGQWDAAPVPAPASDAAPAPAAAAASSEQAAPDTTAHTASADGVPTGAAEAVPPAVPSGAPPALSSQARPRVWESSRGAEWLRRRSELYTLRFDKLGPMVREMGDLRERGVAPLAAVLQNPWAYVQLVALAAHEEELYSSLHQCEMSTQRLGEWKADVVSWVEGMSVDGLPAMLTQAQQSVRAQHVGSSSNSSSAGRSEESRK
jgi:hypothetical protein